MFAGRQLCSKWSQLNVEITIASKLTVPETFPGKHT
jgi:hypothetical protein